MPVLQRTTLGQSQTELHPRSVVNFVSSVQWFWRSLGSCSEPYSSPALLIPHELSIRPILAETTVRNAACWLKPFPATGAIVSIEGRVVADLFRTE